MLVRLPTYTVNQPIQALHLNKWWRMATSILLGLGLLLRVVVWWQQRSIALDEANLIRNYVERTYGQLFQNLDYAQYAPPLFSVMVKACIGLFGNNELSVRLFPLLCSSATLVLFRRLVQRWLPPTFACLALASVAFGAIFIDYASECKQYATEGFVALGLLEVAHLAGSRPLTKRLALGLAALGMMAVWLSMTAVFILMGIGLWWLSRSLLTRDRHTSLLLVLIGVSWMVSFLIYFFMLLKFNAESTYLQQFHHEYFLAFPPFSREKFQLLRGQLAGIADKAIGKTVLAMALATVGALVGSWKLLRRRDELFWLVLVPMLACFTTSALHYYSLIPRLTLFFLPLFIAVVFLGLATLASHRLPFVLILGLSLIVLSNQQRLPHLFRPFYGDYGEVRAGIEYIAQHQRPGEVAFMNYNVSPIAYYYFNQHDPPIHLDLVLLQHPRPSSNDIFEEAIRQMGEQGWGRVWLLYDRENESISTLATAQGRILERYNFERGYVLLVQFARPAPVPDAALGQ